MGVARKRGFVQVTEIAAEPGVSEMTIRHDLIELEREGALVRTHGGAMIEDESAPFLDREEPAFTARLREYNPEKSGIVAKAMTLVERRMSIALDVGSTTYLLAEALCAVPNVKFFTSSLRTAQLLGEAQREVYVPAGQIRGEELSICGKSACDEFERLWFDIAFIGVSDITSDGLFDYSPEDSDLKRVYLRRAGKKVLLCHLPASPRPSPERMWRSQSPLLPLAFDRENHELCLWPRYRHHRHGWPSHSSFTTGDPCPCRCADRPVFQKASSSNDPETDKTIRGSP